MRSSQRQRKSNVLHEDFVEMKSDSEEEEDFDTIQRKYDGEKDNLTTVSSSLPSEKVPYIPGRFRPKKNKRGQKEEKGANEQKPRLCIEELLMTAVFDTMPLRDSAPSSSSAPAIRRTVPLKRSPAPSSSSAPSTRSSAFPTNFRAPGGPLKPAQLFNKTLIPHRRRLIREVIAMSGRDQREMAHLLRMDSEGSEEEEDSEGVTVNSGERVVKMETEEAEDLSAFQAELDKIMKAALGGMTEQKPEHLLEEQETPPTLEYCGRWEAEPIAPMRKREPAEGPEPRGVVRNKFGAPPPRRLQYHQHTVPKCPANPELDRAMHILENQMKTFTGKFDNVAGGLTADQKETYSRRFENLVEKFRNETREAIVAVPTTTSSPPPPWSPSLAGKKKK